MRERDRRNAERYGILERMKALEGDLLKIKYVAAVDFDIDNYDEIPHVIVIPRYDIPVDDARYYSLRRNMLSNIFITCSQHDLWPSGDAVEDMGEHWYIVRRAGDTWPRC